MSRTVHFSTPAPVRVWESHFRLYRTIWKSNVLASFVQPMLYVLGMGVGVGTLVGGGAAVAGLDGLTYLQYIAPAMIATTAMTVCGGEAMWPVLSGFKFVQHYHAAAATPLSAGQIASGVTLWHFTKGLISGGGVAAALALFSETRHPGLILAVVFGALTGVAFAEPIMGWVATREVENSFPLINRFVLIPLFLFGGAFYPIDELPIGAQWVAKALPLWHGVQLSRDATYGRLGFADTIGHLAVLAGFAVVGSLIARRTFRRRIAA
jgi:lipooligosaccharide transport system permease protein